MITKKHILTKTKYFELLFNKAADYYAENAGYHVADRFLTAVEDAINKITQHPHGGSYYTPPKKFEQLIGRHYRKLSLKNISPFPYTIYYVIEEDTIRILSIHHQSRNHERLNLGNL